MTDAVKEKKSPAWKDYDEALGHLEKGELSMAAAGFHNALKDFEMENDEKGIANAASRLADVCVAKKDYSLAVEMLARVEKICAAEDDHVSLMSIKNRQAFALRKSGNYERATALYLDLLDTYHTFNNPDGSIKILEALSETYVDAGDLQKAADALKTAASIHRNFGHKRHASTLEERAAAIEAG